MNSTTFPQSLRSLRHAPSRESFDQGYSRQPLPRDHRRHDMELRDRCGTLRLDANRRTRAELEYGGQLVGRYRSEPNV
ncbi:MAG: hypothetical protein ABI876_07480, partial [Bacteroidota bacterium]